MAERRAERAGRRIQARRRQLGLTQKALAQRMGDAVDGQRISDWERSVNLPSERYWPELAAALEVPDIGYFYEPPESEQTQLDRIEAMLTALVGSQSELAARLERELEEDVRAARRRGRDSAETNSESPG